MLSFVGEAAHLAADFDYVCESEFPAAQLAERQYRQHAEPSQQQSRKNAIIAAKYVLLRYSLWSAYLIASYRDPRFAVFFYVICKKDQVCVRAKWPTRPERIPVSVAWSDQK